MELSNYQHKSIFLPITNILCCISSSFQETDFVCFDTGFDKFDNYDIDSLLGSPLVEGDSENKGTSDQNQVAEDAQKQTQPSADEETEGEKQTEHHDNSEDLDQVPDDESASFLEPNVATESPFAEVESETAPTPAATERTAEDTEITEENSVESDVQIVSEESETKDAPTKSEIESVAKDDDVSENEPVSISEEAQIPELKTTLGSTFDAVTTDDEITKNVSPYEEEESEYVENPPEDEIDHKEETPLLSFSEETVTTPASDFLEKHESPPTTLDDKPDTAEEKNMWTSIGDAVFSVVTGGETIANDFSSDEDEDDDDAEEGAASKIPESFEEAEKDVVEPVSELPKEPEDIDPFLKDPPPFSSAQPDDEEQNSDSEKLLFDQDEESDGEVIGPEGAHMETLKPTEASTIPVDPVSEDDTSAVPEVKTSDLKMADEPIEHDEKEEEIIGGNNDNAYVKDSGVAVEQSEDLDSELVENKTMTDQELARAQTETHQDQSTEETQSEYSDVNDDEKTVDDNLANKIHDRLMTDMEINNTQPELSVKKPETHEELPPEEVEDEKDTEEIEKEEEEKREELLEDENALSFSQSNNSDSDEPLPKTTLPTVSTPEPEYSDSVMRLTLLRDHFTEENMERVQKLLGLRNLFKVEAMFSDLDTELQATRRSHTGTTQDIENALEGILEASENTILDEIEKMLDSQGTKHGYYHQMDESSLDEETEILDDFQELAFSLRQKYSTASDSTPLATEKESDIDQGGFALYYSEYVVKIRAVGLTLL